MKSHLQTNIFKMQKEFSKHFHAEPWFYFFLCIHLICWTAIPALVRENLPLDAIEGTIWGHQLEWGYDKNPYLNAWLTALAVHLGGESGWMIYLFSQLSVVICFWAVWQLAKHMLTPAYALIAVMILEGVQYYNFHAIDFNDNTIELSTWALCIYFFYQSLRSPRYLSWMLTGVFAGLALMAKYYTLTLLTTMLLFLLSTENNRKQLKTFAPYVGLLTFIVIIAPHFIWLSQHDFITVKYVFLRAASPPHFWNHFIYPTRFLCQQLQVFLPALMLFALLFVSKKPRLAPNKMTLSAFNQAFLLYMSLGPLLLTVILTMLLGNVLRAGYGMPLLSLWGIILVAYLPPYLTNKKLYTWLSLFFALLTVSLSLYISSLIDSPDPSSANFPGHELANHITERWHAKYHTDLHYVAGSRWIGGNIAFYSADHPAMFIECNEKHAPWINVNDVKNKGAVFVWGISDNENLPAAVKQQFSQLSTFEIMEISLKRNHNNLPPIKIGLAWLPPQSTL